MLGKDLTQDRPHEQVRSGQEDRELLASSQVLEDEVTSSSEG